MCDIVHNTETLQLEILKLQFPVHLSYFGKKFEILLASNIGHV